MDITFGRDVVSVINEYLWTFEMKEEMNETIRCLSNLQHCGICIHTIGAKCPTSLFNGESMCESERVFRYCYRLCTCSACTRRKDGHHPSTRVLSVHRIIIHCTSLSCFKPKLCTMITLKGVRCKRHPPKHTYGTLCTQHLRIIDENGDHKKFDDDL